MTDRELAERKVRHSLALIDDACEDIRDGVRLFVPVLLTYLLGRPVRDEQVVELHDAICQAERFEDGVDQRILDRRVDELLTAMVAGPIAVAS